MIPRATIIRDDRPPVTIFAQLPDRPDLRAEGLRHVAALAVALDDRALIWPAELVEPSALVAMALSAADASWLVVVLDAQRHPAGDEQWIDAAASATNSTP